MDELVKIEENVDSDIFLITLAREIAMNHFTLDEIQGRFRIHGKPWEKISRNPRFHTILEQEIMAWQGAGNTHERTKLKAAAIMELWMEEASRRLNDARENLPAKVELAKLVARIAGMGVEKMGIEDGSGRVSVVINLGADAKLNFEKQVTPKVIEAKAMDM